MNKYQHMDPIGVGVYTVPTLCKEKKERKKLYIYAGIRYVSGVADSLTLFFISTVHTLCKKQ